MQVTGLSAAVIPQRQWPLRQWFYGPARRYYHRPGKVERCAPGPLFYERLDSELRELCLLLHARGLRTTASCEGHHHDRPYFEQLWEALCDEAEAIRGGGLLVTEAECGRSYWFRDPEYRLPWPDFVSFLSESQRYQTTGYLGVIVPFAEMAIDERLRKASRRLGNLAPEIDDTMGRRFDGRLYHFLVESADEEQRSRKWRHITYWFRDEMGLAI